jgi:hypothetical protein
MISALLGNVIIFWTFSQYHEKLSCNKLLSVLLTQCLKISLSFCFACRVHGAGNAKQEQGYNKHYRQEQSAFPAPAPPAPEASAKPQEKCEGTSQPRLTCDAIAAQAAIEQARYAGKQAEVIWPQFGLGCLTFLAAVGATIFAWRAAFHTKRGADIAEKSGRPWLKLEVDKTINFQFYHDGNGMRLALKSPAWATNFGNSRHEPPGGYTMGLGKA